MLSQFKHSNDAGNRQKDGESTFGIAKAQANNDDREGCKALRSAGAPETGRSPIGTRVMITMAATSSHAAHRKTTLFIMLDVVADAASV